MRNPVRLKNFNARFLPLYVIGLVILATYSPDARSFGFAAPLWIAGALLRGWGAGHLVKNDALTTTGPYAYLRHPLYLGTILIGTGFAIAVRKKSRGVGWRLATASGLIDIARRCRRCGRGGQPGAIRRAVLLNQARPRLLEIPIGDSSATPITTS